MKQEALVKLLKCLCFVTIAVALFAGIQKILTPKWRYPASDEAPADMLEEFYQLAGEADIQAVFLGGSHMEFAVDPMEIYKETNIASFNLASSGQPFPVSCALCSEMFAQNYHPSVVILDVGNLFHTDFFSAGYRYILDNMAYGPSKIQLAESFASERQDGGLYTFLSAFVPIYEYHERWNELSAPDFCPVEKRNLYRKGFFSMSNTVMSPFSVDEMNAIAETLHTSSFWEYTLDQGEARVNEYAGTLYSPEINTNYISDLLAMKQLCEAHNAKLILTKVPSTFAPQDYPSAYTKMKYEIIHEFAVNNGIEFLDLFYDTNLAIDWSVDSSDGGKHLNHNGARKVSSYFADYLQNECGLTGTQCTPYDEDIPIYDAVYQLLDLRSADNLPAYLAGLSQVGNVTVFFSASDDMASGLTSEEKSALDSYGLHTDYISYRSSYAAVKEDDTLLYEAASNHDIRHQGVLANGKNFSILSSGWLTTSRSEIIVDAVNHSFNHRGINIVVMDNASGLVLDSVAFDTCIEGDHPAVRNLVAEEKYLREYEQYLMIQDAKNGIGA